MPTDSEFSDAALQEAEAAIMASQAYQASKGEKVLNKIGNVVIGVNSKYESIASNEIATQALSVVKDHVSNFVQNSKILVGVLDEVAKAHPFIQAAVSLFKAGLTLELTRRENDDKVIALNLTMCDMMQVLTMLKRVADPKTPGPDGLTIEDRLKQRMGTIIGSIKLCAKVCDSYQKRHTAVKFFTSLKWQAKFTDVAQQFADHKAAIQFDLQIHASVGITTANVTLDAMSTDVGRLTENVGKLMEVVFERMRSPEEREVASLVASQPGGVEAALKDDVLLEQVLAAQRSKDGKGARRHASGAGAQPEDRTRTIAELRQEVNKDVEQVLADNKYFDQKFEVVRMQVDEVKVTIRRETDRMIDTLLSGPHERIIDRDMYHVWKETGWRGSVKARHLVMALRDHFAEGSCAALAVIRDITSNPRETSASQVVDEIANIANRVDPNASEEDQWALEYITVLRIQPLIEALDDDVSSFVTVSEVNTFTAARPLTWSLPHWISYWTYGFEMTVQWYFRRIRKVFAEIYYSSNAALPSNLKPISEFIGCWQTRWAEDVLSGLRNVENWDDADWEDDHVFLKFKDYVMENERRMERSLRGVNYSLDAANTLTIVAGEGRPEKYVLPLIFLLMRRALWIIKQAGSVTLHVRELEVISYSLSTLADAVYERVRTLQAMYTLQNQNENGQLSKFFYGLFGPYWLRSPTTDASQITEDVTAVTGENAEAAVPLFYGAQKEDLELLADRASEVNEVAATDSAGVTVTHSLVGHWSGAFAYNGVNWGGDGLVSFSISAHEEDGGVSGSGTDAFGPFAVKGTLVGEQLMFLKEYTILQDGTKVAWRYQGTLDEERDGITGTWGSPDEESQSVAEDDTNDDEPDGDGAGDESNGEDTDCWSPPAEDESGLQDGGEVCEGEEEGEEGGSDEAGDEEDHGSGDGEDTDDSTSGVSSATPVEGGTFFLKRRPLEYLLARPSDEEFAQNRPRALWKLALNYIIRVVQSRTLSWRGLSERRRQRRRYVELVKFKEQFPMDSGTAQEWADLVKGIHPDDLHLWYCIATYQDRRDPVHTSTNCDSCGARAVPGANGTMPFSPSRYLCIDCSNEEVDHSIDLCVNCFSDNKSATRGDTVHSPTHNILQLRTTRLRVYRHTLLSLGTSASRRASVQVDSGLHAPTPLSKARCAECKEPIKGQPFWYCIDCREPAFVCYECNKRVEREKPWLVQWLANADYHNTHDWSHTLVSVPDPDVGGESDEDSKSSTEERLVRLEEKLDKQSADLTSRLDTLEKLLERLLNAAQ
ncbi:hypothetical protein LXA43DRAFT_1087143 [Ganoderma leucocontextum]|nr:hypothetical protein LXA43DRAFT_1087143 [Ganoderma leucocontextum]